MKGDTIMSTSSSVCPRNSCAGGYGNCLDVKITNVCNCRCAFCIERGGFSPKEQKSPVELATATISKQDFKNVLILGGEPLMYPHLLQYLELIRPFKGHIYLTTNGTMLNSQHMSRSDMEKLGKCLDGINISIHHYTEKKNDLVLKGGIESNAPAGHLSFSALKEAIAILQANGCNVRINSNLVPVRLCLWFLYLLGYFGVTAIVTYVSYRKGFKKIFLATSRDKFVNDAFDSIFFAKTRTRFIALILLLQILGWILFNHSGRQKAR